MKRLVCTAVATFGVLVLIGSEAKCDYVTSVSPVNVGQAGGGPLGGDPTYTIPVDTTANNATLTSVSQLAGFPTVVDFGLDFTSYLQPIVVNFGTLSGASIGQPGLSRDYVFRVTVKNSLPPKDAHRFLGMDIALAKISGNGTGTFLFGGSAIAATVPGGTPGSYLNSEGTVTPDLLRFGGLSGGGGYIAPGATAVLAFGMRFAETTGPSSYTLTFTTNPEPGTMALGALAMSVASGVGYRRRKRKVVPSVEPSEEC